MPTLDPRLAVVSATDDETYVDSATLRLPKLDVANPLELFSPIQLPSVDPISVNPTPGSGTVSKLGRKNDEAIGAPVTSASNSMLTKCPAAPMFSDLMSLMNKLALFTNGLGKKAVL